MDGAIRWEGAGFRQGMIGGQDQRISEISAVFDQAPAGVAADKRSSGGHHGRSLEIPDGNTGLLPAVEAENGSLGMTQERFVDGHVGGRGRFGVNEEAAKHGTFKFKLKFKLKKVRRLGWKSPVHIVGCGGWSLDF